MQYDFWASWKNKTQIEKQAIKVILLVRKLIANSIPKRELVAIYIKGSFVRREMKKGSDVDIVPIVTENKYEAKVFAVNCAKIYPAIVVPLSLWELRNNKLYTKGNLPRARPDRFIKKIYNYKLIYGKQLDISKFRVRSDEAALRALIKTFTKSFIPLYKKGKFGFSSLVKEVFWLIDAEQEFKGNCLPHSFKGMDDTIKDPSHIVHVCYKLRLKPTKNKNNRQKFVKKLEKYVLDLNALLK